MTQQREEVLQKVETHIPGLDYICDGGLPENRTTLISGTSGSGKTILAAQFLAAGITEAGYGGVFVTFEESAADIRKNMLSFGWDISAWEAEGRWAFVDVSPQPEQDTIVIGDFDMGALLVRIEHAMKKVNARRLVLDSIGSVFSQFENATIVRRELFRVAAAVKRMEVTAILTAERTDEYGDIARFGVEEFVSDNVIILRNVLEDEKRRRTIEILKFRGTSHGKGEWPYSILPKQGIVAIPLSAMELKQRSSSVRITSGCPELDEMCSGGFFRDSVILVSGATGTGKTLMVSEFMASGANNSEKALLFAFEESRDQLFRNGAGWGFDFERIEKENLMRVECMYPETAGLEDHLIGMKRVIEEYKPSRVAIDSLSALERISTIKWFREFVIGITSFIKKNEIAAMFTSTTDTLVGGSSVTEANISTITDSIILLRYVELLGEMRRGITVLKMRGSAHDKDIREFTIDGSGMHIGKPFRNVTGILAGNPSQVTSAEIDRLDDLFKE